MVYWRVTFRAVQGILLDAGSIRRELVVNKNSLAQPPQVALSVKTAPTQQSAILTGLQEETHLLKIISSDTEFSIRSSTCLHVRLHRRPHRRYQSHSAPLPHGARRGKTLFPNAELNLLSPGSGCPLQAGTGHVRPGRSPGRY